MCKDKTNRIDMPRMQVVYLLSVLAPYYCAGVGGTTSAAACASLPSLISTTIETAATYEENALGVIDDPNNMKNDRIWIFNGQNDTKMHPGMSTIYPFPPATEFVVCSLSLVCICS